MLRTTKSKEPLKVKLKYLAAYFPITWPEAYLFTKDDSKKPGDVTQCSSPEVRMCQTVILNYHNLREEKGAKILGLIQGTDVEVQSGDLSLVQIHPDTVLRLVGIMVLLRQLSYVIKTQLKPPKVPNLAQFLPFAVSLRH